MLVVLIQNNLLEFFDDWVEIVVKATVKAVKDYERLNPLRNANRNVSRDLVSSFEKNTWPPIKSAIAIAVELFPVPS